MKNQSRITKLIKELSQLSDYELNSFVFTKQERETINLVLDYKYKRNSFAL